VRGKNRAVLAEANTVEPLADIFHQAKPRTGFLLSACQAQILVVAAIDDRVAMPFCSSS
jgi:hypothetical protein